MAEIVLYSVFLLMAAWQDGKEKSISLWLFLVFGIAGFLILIWSGPDNYDRLFGILPGVLLLVLSRVSGGAIGEGDGLFFVVGGIYMGFSASITLLLYGALLNGAVCAVIYLKGILAGEDRRKVTVPFLPCLVPVWIEMVAL